MSLFFAPGRAFVFRVSFLMAFPPAEQCRSMQSPLDRPRNDTLKAKQWKALTNAESSLWELIEGIYSDHPVDSPQ